MATSLDLAKTYTSYSGVDIRVVVNGEAVGSMQAISYAIQREKAPIYVMGRVDPRSFSRGKRGIAGTMISLLLDRHLLYTGSFVGEEAVLDADEIYAAGGRGDLTGGDPGRYEAVRGDAGDPNRGVSGLDDYLNDATNSNALRSLRGATLGPQRGLDAVEAAQGSYIEEEISRNYFNAPVYYVDQILPFDVTIVAVNEYGNAAQMRMYGCEILNEGSGFSIDDMVVENQMTYICRTILPWQSFSGGGSTKEDPNGWISQLYNNARERTPVVGVVPGRG